MNILTVHIKTAERILLLLSDPFNPLLRNHKLHGLHDGYRSINITGELYE